MKPVSRPCSWLAVAGALALALPASAQSISLGQKAKVEGIITHRAGTSMAVKSEEQGAIAVVLTENTDVKATKGRLGLLKQGAAATALIPGLRVSVQGMGDDKGQIIASSVRFTTGDLEAAQAIQAGLAETKDRLDATDARVAENRKDIDQLKTDQAGLNRRFDDLGEYDLRAEATVYFEVGKATLSPEGEKELSRVAGEAKALKGYLIGVEGYADASGSATVNQKLSLERSQAVVNWLAQKGGIPFVRMLAPGAMSTAAPAASNETASGRAQNRRVTVKVLVNRGIAGS